MTSIQFSRVAKSFGAVPVIRDVNLAIGEGEFCVFLGPSGCGKSTLLRMIAGLETEFAGEIRIDGRIVNTLRPAEREVAMVFQNYALYPHMTVFENMAFGLRQTGVPKPEILARVNEAARILRVEPLLERMPKALSGGQRQRVAIGRAIVRKPKVFLFDEPLSNLDAALRVHMRTEIATLHRNFPSASVVYVTHDQTEAMALADKIVLLHAGKDMLDHGSVAQVGGPLDLYHRPRNLFVAGFLGSPTMNFMQGTLAAIHATGCAVDLDQGERVVLPIEARGLALGDQVTLGIRPEHLHLSDASLGGPAATGLARRVDAVEHFGEYTFLYFAANGTPLIAKVPGDSPLAVGDVATVILPPAQCHLFGPDGEALPPLPAT